MKHICFEVGKYVSSIVSVPADLNGTFYAKWVGTSFRFRKKKIKPLFSINYDEPFIFRIKVANNLWHVEEITIFAGKNPVPVILSCGRGTVFFYHKDGDVVEIIVHLNKLNNTNKHRLECIIDSRSLGRAQKMVTDDNGERIYTWSSEMSRYSSSSQYEWDPSSQTVKALVSSRTLNRKRVNSFGDKDDCINGHKVLPVKFDTTSSLYLRFDNHKYNVPRSVVVSFSNINLSETSGATTTKVVNSNLVVTVYYNRDTTLSVYMVELIVPNYLKDLEFKKEYRYNTN